MTARKKKFDKRILVGNCLDTLKKLDDASISSIVTDPPYELGFMGKSWDASGIAYNVEVWRECLRVLKPGGHLLAFGGTRTYHRMAVAIEDAGFEIRDSIHWVYGSGFPKSHDVSKAIDKSAGAEREVVGTKQGTTADPSTGRTDMPGKATGVKQVGIDLDITAPATDAAKQWQGWGTALKPAHEPIVLARKPLTGTVAATVLTHGTGAINIDGCRIGGETLPAQVRGVSKIGTFEGADGNITPERTGRWPANIIHDGSEDVLALFPDTKGARHFNNDGEPTGYETSKTDNSVASAARFFYCAKPGKKERNAGGTNTHPTVKPLALMRYLVRLITPPGGIVLDPFLGSGTTAMAAILEGFDWRGCELTPEYLPIIDGRVKWAAKAYKLEQPKLPLDS